MNIMRNKFFILGSFTLLLYWTQSVIARDGEPGYKNYVLMVSMDAWRWDYSNIYNTPNINRFAARGVKAGRLIPSFPTNTFPNHYSIATGLYPDHHGLVNNTFYAPDLGLLYRIGDRKAVENPGFYGGEPIWVTAEKQGIISASFFWVGSEAIHPAYWKTYSEEITYEERIDTVVKWLAYPANKRPGLVTLYFDEPDATSHDSGPVSEETRKVAERLDSLFGVLLKKIETLPHASKINIILLSDHGMAQISPQRYVNLRNVVPERMIAGIYGSNPVYLLDATEGKTDSVLILTNQTKGIKAYRKEDIPARLNYGTNPRIPEIVVIADSSWSIGLRPDPTDYKGGAHGYDNANPDMHAFFSANGPAFRKRKYIESLDNVDIYNIICEVLGIQPSPNDGDPGVVHKMMKKGYLK